MKKYSKYAAAILVCATCIQLSACGISDIPGLSDIAGTEGISAFKETADDINEFADGASSFVSQITEDVDAKGIIDELKKATES